MIKSIKEVPLFMEDIDKVLYMNIMRDYQKVYDFKVYAYCLMTNHAHFIIDANGADISKIMHAINFKYAVKFNKRHDRYGHLFQERFKSKIVESDSYLYTLSAYIHNNVLAIKKYRDHPERYKFSSLAVYLGLRTDPFEILDEKFIFQMIGQDVSKARQCYYKYVYACDNEKIKENVEFQDEKTCYKSERHILVRNFAPETILEFVAEKTCIEKYKFFWKHQKGAVESRALAALLMRSLCNFRCSDICRILGNITQSRVSKLCSIGYKLMCEDERYKNVFYEFINKYAA